MKKDTKNALDWMEAELLSQETPEIEDEDLDAIMEEFSQAPTPVSGVKIRNTDKTDTDLNAYSDRVYEEPTQSGRGLNLLALFSIAVSAAALVYMVLRLQ